MVKNIEQFLEELFASFNPKQRKVITARFGLKNGTRATLQEIGDELGITRERVRQIEEFTLKKVGAKIRETGGPLMEFVENYLNEIEGVRRDDMFVREVAEKFFAGDTGKYNDEKIRFMLCAAGKPLYAKETDDANAFWYSDEGAKKKFIDFVKNATTFFKGNSYYKLTNDKTLLAQSRTFSIHHFFSIPKHFGVNVFGDVGLRAWPEIEPRTVRDRAYLVLKKNGEPLHFRDIAKSIQKLGIATEAAHVQTVHNELIKDDRFVLVGRGIYGLRELGFEAGTVREVIMRILKKKGAMHAPQVVRLVGEQRFLKTNTILLSLQNRRYFKRLDDGRYHVKEA